jgi:hypothetical protein
MHVLGNDWSSCARAVVKNNRALVQVRGSYPMYSPFGHRRYEGRTRKELVRQYYMIFQDLIVYTFLGTAFDVRDCVTVRDQTELFLL